MKKAHRNVRLLAGRLLALALGLALTLSLAPGLASAHAELKSSTPADGATVGAGLAEITLVFSEEISVDDSTATISGPNGAVSGVTAAVNRADRTKLVVTTSPLTGGAYKVNWKAVTADDNGITNGTLNFTVGSGTTTSGGSAEGSTTTSAPSGGSTTTASGGTGGDLPNTGSGDMVGVVALGALLALVCVGGGLALKRTRA